MQGLSLTEANATLPHTDTTPEVGVTNTCGTQVTIQGNGLGGWTDEEPYRWQDFWYHPLLVMTQRAAHDEAEALRESAGKVRMPVLALTFCFQ